MRVLVTGAAGFIGQHLVAALARRGHTSVSIDKAWGQSTTDLGRLDGIVDMVGPHLIAHLGANCSTRRSLDNPASDFEDNAIGTFNVAETARQHGNIPVLFTSTVKVNAGHDGQVAPLGLSKQVGEQYLHAYRQLYGLSSVILRPSTVYGPGQLGSPESGWVGWFIRAALTGQRVQLAGDGTQSRDILYIDDMIALLVDIIEHHDQYATVGQFDVGGGPDNEITLNTLLGRRDLDDHRYFTVPRPPGDLQRVVTDNTAITAVNGWTPTVRWQDGVARTRAWMTKEINP